MVAGTLLTGSGRLRENQQPFGLQPILPIMAVHAAATLIQLVSQLLDACPAVIGRSAVALFVRQGLTILALLHRCLRGGEGSPLSSIGLRGRFSPGSCHVWRLHA